MNNTPYLYPRRIVLRYIPGHTLGVQHFEADSDIFGFEKTLE